MRCNLFLGLFFSIFFYSISFSQSTFFIKYKNSIDRSVIEEKVETQNFLSQSINSPLKNSAENPKVEFFAKNSAKNIEDLSRIIKVTFKDEVDAQSFLELQNLDSSIEYIQPAATYKIDFTPNDSLISEQWALNKIKAFDAWNITQGSDTVLLGVIDTGIDYLHTDLKNKIYLNPGENGTDNFGNEKRSNGIDDDGNGFIDDWQGWDFTDRVGFPFDSTGGDYLTWDNDPKDEQGHGTYIAGIAGAETNNLTGIAGTAPNIKMLNLRAFDPGGYGEEDDVAAAILYAINSGVKVINMSFGDNAFSYVLRDVIRYAYSQNVVLIASAGNSGSDHPHYPSGYSEVIAVGNSTSSDAVAGSSNFGSTIDLVAPGSLIITTGMDNSYALISGTSASAPFVSASSALVLSLQNFTNEEIKQILKSTADDIGTAGWDLKSGAGRLNLFKAVSVIAPSIVKFNYPYQDFATLQDTLSIKATILSPYFESYDLYYGTGFNPSNWTSLIQGGTNQFTNEDIFTLNTSQLPDTVYALRIVVNQNNGKTLEERINFHVNRTPPQTELISIGPAFYGDRTTVMAAIYTDEPCIAKIYYRKIGQNNFNYITLDGFATNNQFVKNLHYGFLPKQLIEQNASYEIYLEAENLVGLKTTIKNGANNFIVFTQNDFNISGETEMPFTLPAGNIFGKPLNLTSDDYNEIAIRENNNPRFSSIYKLMNDEFVKIDSLEEKIIKDYGDFNGNGKMDLLTYFVYDGFLMEQTSAGSTTFNQQYSDSSESFWPILADDIDNDGITEALAAFNDTSIIVWKINPDLSLKDSVKLTNFSNKEAFGNLINSPNAVVADLNEDSKNEIWMVDREGDIFSYNVDGPKMFSKNKTVSTGFSSSSAYLTIGDYDNDGKKELAVLVHSIPEIDVAPFYRLLVFNFVNDSLNILQDWAFVDASTEFNTSFQKADNSIMFEDVDNDGADELILFTFPYAYIFKRNDGKNIVISYKENINSNTVFAGDLNGNGVKEIAFPTEDGIKFFEFANSNKTSTPHGLSGYSLDTTNIYLKWEGDQAVNKYYIFRGVTKENLALIDSVTAKEFIDGNIQLNKNYYYAVQAFNLMKEEPFSNLTLPVEVFHHKPAEAESVNSKSQRTVEVYFSDKVNNTIENLQSFEVSGEGFPVSISPLSQYGYLLTFNTELDTGSNKLIVKNLRDFYGSPIAEDTLDFAVSTVETQDEFFISSHEIINSFRIRISFNLPVEENTAKNISNYSFDPDNSVESIEVSPDKKTIYLNLKKAKPIGSIGKEYRLKIANIFSGSGLAINSGAGSYLVLTSFANNLDDVYVYPNPAKAGSGANIVFANLPQKAKITIFNLSGKQIKTIEETDGNGGVDFDLKDDEGNDLNSGIYIFRIVMLDNSNNESGEKIGKFAVIK